MSITDTVSSVAAANPVVGVAVARQSIGSAILSGLQSGDTSTAPLLQAVSSQAQEVNTLMTSLQPHLGQNVNASV
jgi:hypothetical protein